MTEKCVNTGNWIEMCDALTEVTRNQYGDIQAQVMSARSRNASRLRIVAGRFKKNRVELNFCPFCGVDIVTDYQDQGVNDESEQGDKHANE